MSIAYVYTRQCIGIRRIATREGVVEPVYPLKNEIFEGHGHGRRHGAFSGTTKLIYLINFRSKISSPVTTFTAYNSQHLKCKQTDNARNLENGSSNCSAGVPGVEGLLVDKAILLLKYVISEHRTQPGYYQF